MTIFFIVVGQACFLGGIGYCVQHIPAYALGKNQGGLSNYGSDRRTVAAYGLAFILASVCSFLAALTTPADAPHALAIKRIFIVLSVLLLIVMTSTFPYKRSRFLHDLHFFCGYLYGIYALLISILFLTFRSDIFCWTAFGIELAGAIVSFLSLRNVIQKLFFGQMIIINGFALLAIAALI